MEKESAEKEYWDEIYWSKEFLKHWDFAYPSPELVAVAAAGVIPAGGRVLDIGCGAGREAIFLAACGYRVTGVDLSPAALAIARARARRAQAAVDWREGSVFDLPVESAAIDFINDRGVLHNLAEKVRPGYGAEITRVFKPGGAIFIRGAGIRCAASGFTPITEKSLDRIFPARAFRRGPVLPLPLVSDAGIMDAVAVLVWKKRR